MDLFNKLLADMSWSIILSAILIGVLTWRIIRRFIRWQGLLPPGPLGLPLVGVIPFLGEHPQKQITKWGKSYGRIYSMYIGQRFAVVVNDYEAIRAALVDQAENFTGRPPTLLFEAFSRGGYGIIVSESDNFREQRRFLLKSFHELGVGKSRFEHLCLEEADALVEQLLSNSAKSGGKGFRPDETIFYSVASVLTALMYGKRFGDEDPRLRQALINSRLFQEIAQQAGPVMMFPWLRYVPPFRAVWKRMLAFREVHACLSEPEVTLTAREYDGSEPRCLTEHYLKRRSEIFALKNNNKQKASPDHMAVQDKLVHMDNIITNVENVFGAGTDTSVMTLLWAFIFMLNFPQVQQKCYEDIKTQIGTDRPVCWEDRHALPYVEAFFLEVWRRGNLVPLSLEHRNMHATHLCGYFIPKHTVVIANLWNVHWNEKYFDDPMSFRPERFINVATGKIDRTLPFIPFSVGKRSCVGESIARMELFLFLANMLQRVEIVMPDNDTSIPSLDNFTTSLTVAPAPFNISVKSRI